MRIFVADNQDVVRRGLRVLLAGQPGWLVCGETRNGREAVELAFKLKPEIVVLDLDLLDLNGIETTRSIKETLPETEVLFFTMHQEDHVISEALKAGARGYVLKSDSEEKVIEAVQALAKHQPYFSARASEMLLSLLLDPAPDSQGVTLSDREREIVQLLADGKSNKEAADLLHISTKTVETHRAAIMRKLGLKSVTELVRYAIRNKLTQP